METIEIKLPYSEVTLVLDALRHYINYIENVNESEIDEDTLADLLNDNENVKAVEKQISSLYSEKFGEY
ncbi:MAG: hypothetical protein B0W54_23540 [Cellvibrio sp. 79]|nr:MAG: hypothetical protein B0W54_23540 [Cellvibrio sp. 79]